MKFQYYWDYGIFPDHDPGNSDEDIMGTPADIQRLMERIKRAQSLTDRAATHGNEAEKIMDNFEKTLSNSESHFGNIAEYDKQLAAMMAISGNGGPPLDATFHSTGEFVQQIHPNTGDPVKK